MKRELNVFEIHQRKIALQTLRMPDVAVLIMGGMNKEEAREFLRSIGYSAEAINKVESVN